MHHTCGTTYDKLRGNLNIDNISIDYGYLIDDVSDLKNRTIVFCLGKKTQKIIYPMIIQCPNNFSIKNITGVCSNNGIRENTKIIIQKINYYDFHMHKDNWVDIIDENEPIVFKPNKNTIEENYVVTNNIISKDDLLRIKVLEKDSDITDITINININIIGSKHKNGTSLISAKTKTQKVVDEFITSETMVVIAPLIMKLGYWTVESFKGYFIVTSDVDEEHDVSFVWGATK